MAVNAYFQGVGRRKASVARVHIAPLKGKKGAVEINGQPIAEYFSDQDRVDTAMQPFEVLSLNSEDYAVKISTQGGGCSGQAGAISLGLARALNALEMHQLGLSKEEAHAMQEEAAAAVLAASAEVEEETALDDSEIVSTSKRAWYMALKRKKLLRVDARRVERKKVGRVGARKKPQYSKR